MILALLGALVAPVAVTSSAKASVWDAGCGVISGQRREYLYVQDCLAPGGVVTSATSRTGSYDDLEMQFDGNLVLYHNTGYGQSRAVWASNTRGAGNYVEMTLDGNLVLYNSAGWPLWFARSPGVAPNYGAVLKVQVDDKLVIYSGVPYWVPLYWTCEWDRRSPTLPFC